MKYYSLYVKIGVACSTVGSNELIELSYNYKEYKNGYD